MDTRDAFFFAEMYSLVKKMEETIEEFDMKDRVLATIVVGVLDLDAIEYGESEAEMKTMYSFNLQNRAELDALKEVMDGAYKDEDNNIDLDDLLDGLGISLN